MRQALISPPTWPTHRGAARWPEPFPSDHRSTAHCLIPPRCLGCSQHWGPCLEPGEKNRKRFILNTLVFLKKPRWLLRTFAWMCLLSPVFLLYVCLDDCLALFYTPGSYPVLSKSIEFFKWKQGVFSMDLSLSRIMGDSIMNSFTICTLQSVEVKFRNSPKQT